MTKYLVECVAQYRMVYAIDADSPESAVEVVREGKVEELGQTYLGDVILHTRNVDDTEILRVFDEMSPWCKSWEPEKKLQQVHVVKACETT